MNIKNAFYAIYIKRPMDIILSLAAIVVLAPVMLLVAVLVRKKLGKPILFAQERIGLHEKYFKLYKFRTMTDEKDANGEFLSDEKRLNSFGKLLRSISLDELPELFSIFNGDMSFVGPRPLPTFYLPYFIGGEHKRHNVRGGLIPPDSLCGELMPSWETQFKYDAYYSDNVSFLLDLKIIFVTFKVIFSRIKDNYGGTERLRLDIYRENNIKAYRRGYNE